jgi:hypothetical protein
MVIENGAEHVRRWPSSWRLKIHLGAAGGLLWCKNIKGKKGHVTVGGRAMCEPHAPVPSSQK